MATESVKLLVVGFSVSDPRWEAMQTLLGDGWAVVNVGTALADDPDKFVRGAWVVGNRMLSAVVFLPGALEHWKGMYGGTKDVTMVWLERHVFPRRLPDCRFVQL